MDTAGKSAAQLREQIARAEEELQNLKAQLAQAEAQEREREQQKPEGGGGVVNGSAWKWPLKAEEYDRYGRQLILPNVGIQGQTILVPKVGIVLLIVPP